MEKSRPMVIIAIQMEKKLIILGIIYTKEYLVTNNNEKYEADKFEYVDSCSSQLTIISDVLTGKEIEDFLGIQSTSFCTKGELYKYPSGIEKTSNINAWYIDSEKIVLSKNFEDHLQFVLTKIHPIRKKLNELRDSGKVRMSLYGSWEGEMHAGPTITSNQMKMMGEIGLDLELLFSSYRNDE